MTPSSDAPASPLRVDVAAPGGTVGDLPSGPLVSADLAPTPPEGRTWNLWHIASLWVGMSVCIPSYMLAAGMIEAGLSWRMALLAVLLGNAIVWVPLVINAHAGTRYGIPFPVYARASFGTRGAHIPAVLRAIVACGWFGIQTWVGGMAIDVILGILWPGWAGLGGEWRFMGYGLPQYLAFLIFWVVNLYFVWAGTEGIKWLETLSAPLLIAAGLALLWWGAEVSGGFGRMLGGAERLSAGGGPRDGFTMGVFLPWVTAMVGYWATLSLNISDFTRYARSQRDQTVGQALGLLTTMPLFAFIGIAVTSATILVYGEAIWNPVELVARLTREQGSAWLGLVSMVVIAVATLTTNIAANIVSPAFTLANLAPRRISFRAGGVIAAVFGLVIFPWKLLDLYQGWLLTYSGLLGAVGGVILADYTLVRRGRLDVRALYDEHGPYRYAGGVNPRAVVALAVGVAVALAGLVAPGLRFLFDGAWFSATLVSFVTYALLMRSAPATEVRAGPTVPGLP
ncbi:MAG TPA: NCS1 family nucleobase:cation symporter-1 [Longimicrobiaceae bacterium]|nr:NCS1 family nucleobase:cation symporter-1 [Longimicrobiaceae bacterium]